jgi:Pyridoxamine 5'-phosphate oxidase
MIPEKLLQVLRHEGVVAIVTLGEKGPHVVNTWNSYIQLTEDEHLLIPVGGMIQTEANIDKNNDVLITLGTRAVEGFRGPGTGFFIKGTAIFLKSGKSFDLVKSKFPWIRAALDVSNLNSTQTL